MNVIGAIGSLCFAFCLLPQVIEAYRDKSADGLSWLFLVLSICGNVASCGYVLWTNWLSGVYQYPLYFNYAFALVLCALLVVAKVRYRLNIGEYYVLTPKDQAQLEKLMGIIDNELELKPSKVEIFKEK